MGFLGKRSPHGGIKIYYVFYEFLTLNPFRNRASPLLTPKGLFIEVMSKMLQLEFAFVYHLFHIVLYSSSMNSTRAVVSLAFASALVLLFESFGYRIWLRHKL